ncbi:hypothetical protein D7X74_04360 [Corallococcus sp. CA047B]|nr:hypothetical protein D7X74_04360 [Corallococcus sp. CA047B]
MFLGAWGMARPPSAEACSPPLCIASNSIVPLPPDAVVPANVPALVVLPPPINFVDEQSLRLRTEEGVDVEARVLRGPRGSGVLVPAAPLIPGTRYHLEGTPSCGSSPHEPGGAAAAFTAGPQVALPTVTGTLQAAPEQHGAFRVSGGASCWQSVEGSTVTLGFTPAPELVPFLPWVHWTLKVDGQTWATAWHGAVDSSGGVTPSDGFRTMRDLLTVYSICDDPRSPQDSTGTGLVPGRHVATLHPVLEQSGTALPVLEASFDLTCPQDASDPEPKPEPEAPRSEGCSQAGGGLTAFGLLATLQLWRRRTAKDRA